MSRSPPARRREGAPLVRRGGHGSRCARRKFRIADGRELAFIACTELSVRTARSSRFSRTAASLTPAKAWKEAGSPSTRFARRRSSAQHGVTTPNWQVIRDRPDADDSNSVRHQSAAPGLDRRRLHHARTDREIASGFAGRREIRSANFSSRNLFRGAS